MLHVPKPSRRKLHCAFGAKAQSPQAAALLGSDSRAAASGLGKGEGAQPFPTRLVETSINQKKASRAKTPTKTVLITPCGALQKKQDAKEQCLESAGIIATSGGPLRRNRISDCFFASEVVLAFY